MTISKTIFILVGGLTAVLFMVSALWGWQNASILVKDAARPEVAVWAIRSGAIALAAAAQGIAVGLVVQKLYRQDQLGNALRVVAALVFSLALVSAIALGMAGK